MSLFIGFLIHLIFSKGILIEVQHTCFKERELLLISPNKRFKDQIA